MGDFVTVSSDKTQLELNGQPFRIVGANSYHVQTHGADYPLKVVDRRGIPTSQLVNSGRKHIAGFLQSAADQGINVLRIWAHNEHCEEFKWWDNNKRQWEPFSNTWKTIQKEPSKDDIAKFRPNIDNEGIDGLDWVVAEAGRLGIKLIMSLTNYWKDFGGMPQYARWAAGKKDGLEYEMQVKFLEEGKAHTMLKAYIQFLLNRRNPYNEIYYKDDPTILAWSIANEPRGRGDTSGNRLDDWIKDTTNFIRSLDKKHLITVDTEGFFIRDEKVEIGPDEKIDIDVDYMNPGERSEGCDFLRNASHPNVDFACIHMYQEKWAPDYAKGDGKDPQQWDWIYKWLDVHLAICKKKLQKPLVLSEFSEIAYNDDFAKRREFLKKVYRWLEKGMYSNDFVAGSCYWMICEDRFKTSDGDKRFIIIDKDRDDGNRELTDHAKKFPVVKAAAPTPDVAAQ